MLTKNQLAAIIACTALSTNAVAAPNTPVVATPVYTEVYSYDKTMPTTLATRFTYHKDFVNIYLLDQSVWRVTRISDIEEIKTWNYTDPIVLKTNTWSLSQTLYNTVRNRSVKVKFSCAPDANSAHAFSIYALPGNSNILTLYKSDGYYAYVEIYNTHLYKVQNWSVFDQIVIAWNKEKYPWNLDYPFTLINTRTGETVDCESVIYQ
ncbi:hypothetical protein K0U07_03560 [bacterium]|nr:hypothetical protein [bacterium]